MDAAPPLKTFLVYATRKADHINCYPGNDTLECLYSCEWIVLAQNELDAGKIVMDIIKDRYEEVPSDCTTDGWSCQKIVDATDFATTEKTRELYYCKILGSEV
jgi:hypothetical protein